MSENIGKIKQVLGAVVDVSFDENSSMLTKQRFTFLTSSSYNEKGEFDQSK